MLLTRRTSGFAAALATFATLSGFSLAQMISSTYVDASSGINFSAWSADPAAGNGPFTFGFVLPEDALTKNSDEYVGMLQCQSMSANKTGWCGIAHAGGMTSDLLLMAWPYQGHVFTSFRWINDYFMPPQFGGPNGTNGTSAAFPPPVLNVISTSVNATGFQILYRCQHCFAFAQGSFNETVATAGDPDNVLVLGYAQAGLGPLNPGCPGNNLRFGFHDNGYGQWGAPVANATRTGYSTWTKLATQMPNAAAVNATLASCSASGPTSSASSPAGRKRARKIRK